MTGNYGIALVLLSLFSFVVMYSFNKRAQLIQNKEHKIQAILSPQIDEIKKRYTGREQYEQLQWLYKRYGYHPLYAIRSALGFVFQIPFLTAAYYMLSGLPDIQGVSWGFIPNLGQPDHLLAGISLLPFVMTLVTCVYAFVMPSISKKERFQTVVIGVFFLVLLYTAPSALLVFWTCNLFWSLLDSVLGQKLTWVGDFITENELAFHIIFVLSLTVGVLVPTDIYIKNASQLWFDYRDVLKYFLSDTVKYIVALLLLYIICWRKRIRGICLSVLLGLLFGIFLQSYIISVDYGMFDGHEIEWEKYTKVGVLNTFIWLFCLVETFVIFKRIRFDIDRIKKYVKPITFCIIAVQCVVLLITLKNHPIQKYIQYDDGRARVLTTKNLYTVSAKDNIIIFLIDEFDAAIFEEILQNNSKIWSVFKDFTYYPDSTSSFGFTIYSLPEILTGKLFDPAFQKYPDYLKAAWGNNYYYNVLRDNNYSINLYTSGDYTDRNAPIDNLVTEKATVDRHVADKFGNLAGFRIVPHYFKKFFYLYNTNIRDTMVIADNIVPYHIDDRAFYDNLCKGLKLNGDNNCFQFYHLEGVHYPWNLDENLEPLGEEETGTAYKAALGRLKIVHEYLKQIKQYQVYNNATIVILADHGHHNTVGRCPVFLIKHSLNQHDSLMVNKTPIVVADLMPIIFRGFANNHKTDINKVIDVENRNRVFYYENRDGSFTKYLITGNARDNTKWEPIGKVGLYRDGDRYYKIGEIIDFSSYGNSERYKESGWTVSPDIRYSAFSQFDAAIVLDIKDELQRKSDYIIKMRIHPALFLWEFPKKGLSLYANNILIGNWVFEKDEFEDISCALPRHLLNNKQSLSLRFSIDVPPNIKDDERFNTRGNVKLIIESMQIVGMDN